MQDFRRMSVGKDTYAHCDIAVADRMDRRTVFMSVIGYDSIVKRFVSEAKKNNDTYMPGLGHGKTFVDYEVEVQKMPGDDFSHAVLRAKDRYEDATDQMIGYILYNTEEELKKSMMKKIVEYTPVPVLDEWTEYLYNAFSMDGKISECIVKHSYDKAPFQIRKLVVNKQDLIAYISSGLRNGEISIDGENESSDYLKDICGLNQYLNAFSDTLAVGIQEAFKPKYMPGESKVSSYLEEYDQNCFDNNIELFEAQRSIIQSSVNNLDKNDTSFIIAEMGSGKTLMGAGIPYVHAKGKPYVSLVMCPSHLVNKWRREVDRLVPNSRSYVIHNYIDIIKLEDVIKNNPDKKNIYMIISKDRAKFGYDMKPAAIWSKSKKTFVCPECGQSLYTEKFVNINGTRIKQPTDFDQLDMTKEYAYNQKCMNKVKVWNNSSKRWDENDCNASLWTPLNGDRSDKKWTKACTDGWIMTEHLEDAFNILNEKEKKIKKEKDLMKAIAKKIRESKKDDYVPYVRAPRKVSTSSYVKKKLKGCIDYLIVDELHQLKSESMQGQSFDDFVKASKKTICLTGTLLNGYADSIFYILYRTCPRMMKKAGFEFSDSMKFMREYGVIKKTTKSSYRSTSKEEKKPGVSPLVFTKFLLENSAFLSLSEMAEGLPPYREIPVPVEMDRALEAKYKEVESKIKKAMNPNKGGAMKIMGAFLQTLTTYPDMPYDNPPIVHPDTSEVLAEIPEMEREVRNKERELLEIVKRKKAAGEKVLVYYSWTKRTDVGGKLKSYLEENDIKVAILEDVKPDDREEWIEARVAEGIDVVICNPTLVETGLDLLDFTTIVFYQIGYSIFTMRQASRRSWRLSQEHPIEVYFMYYKDTIQEQALSLMATKLQASMAIEGKFSEEGLRAMSNNEDLLTQVANSVVSGMKKSVDETMFAGVATNATAIASSKRYRRKRLNFLKALNRKTERPSYMDLFSDMKKVANLF